MYEVQHATATIAEKLRQVRIGYAPQSQDYSYPGDRRRFCYYARARGLSFERADPAEDYDVVVVSQGGDLSRWSRYAGKGRVIFDFVDSYLDEKSSDLRPMLRGLAKYAFRQTKHLHLDYRALLEDMCERSDAVVCTNPAQRSKIERHCDNVHVILDIQNAATRAVKEDYSRGPVFNLVWEGLPGNVVTHGVIADALRRLQSRYSIALHLITDLESPLALRNVGRVSTKRLVRRALPGVKNVYLYEWNEELFASICTACDLAVVPIPLDQPIYAGKPESKLILFWRMGLPVITSATPAYASVMRAAGLEMTCRDTDEWLAILELYMEDESLRKDAAVRGRAYATREYSEERLLGKWDAVFESVLSF